MNIYEIAFLAGVSTATVSRVLNHSGCVSEDTRKKVEAVIAREEYIPNAYAHSLTTKQSHTIGIICPDISDANHAYPVAVLSHLLRAQGFEILLIGTSNNEESKRQHFVSLIRRQVEAAIVISCNATEEEKADFRYAAGHFPVFILNGEIEGERIYSVRCDEYAAASGIVRMFVDAGRKHVLYLYDSHTYSGQMKMEGYRHGMNAYSHEEPMLVFIDGGTLSVLPYAMEQISCLLDQFTFDAVLAADDLLAIAVEKALRQAKRPSVPMVGFNNSTFSITATPELSSVDIRLANQCEIIVQNLLKVLSGGHPDSSTVLDTKLYKRESLLRYMPNS